MLKKILIGLGVVVVALCAVIATRPATYHVERSISISAPAEAVFPFANDLRKLIAWTPWSKLDPAMKTTFTGPEQGSGASYTWVGNDKVGEGRMTITDSKLNQRVEYKLEFIKPFASVAATAIAFTPEGEGLRVVWSMDGNNNFVSKAFSMFVNMDQMIGKDFEAGLATLKGAGEAEAQRLAAEARKKAAEVAAAGAERPIEPGPPTPAGKLR